MYHFLVGCVWIWFGGKDEDTLIYEICGVASVIGVGVSAMSITSLALIACFIGPNIGNISIMS